MPLANQKLRPLIGCFRSRLFRCNRERKQIQFANTEHTSQCITCNHSNIIIYSSKEEQHIMWITRPKGASSFFLTKLGFKKPCIHKPIFT